MNKNRDRTIKYIVLAALIALIYASVASGLDVTASTGNNGDSSATGVRFGATVKDYASEHIKLNHEESSISNTFYGTGSLPYGYISKSDSAGNYASAYRSISGVSGVTSWNYDWNTYRMYSYTNGYGVGAWLRFNVNRAYSFSGGSKSRNNEGDYASSYTSASSSGSTTAYLSNMYTEAYAYSNKVFSKLSADYGAAANYLYFDTSSGNKEGEYSYHWIDAYGTSSNLARTYYPYVDSTATKTYAGVYGQTSGAYGSSAIFRTHTENKAKTIGHEGTYYTGGGDFGVNIKNYNKLSGSVLGQAYTSNVYLYPSTNVPSYRTACLLDPFRSEWVIKKGYKDWGYDSFYALMNKGHAVTYYRDSSVTQDRVGELDNYYVSAISAHMGPNVIELTRGDVSSADRQVTGSELASMFTKNPQGMIYLDGCSSFSPSANSALANAVKNKEWLSGGYTVSVNAKGDNLLMSKFFDYLTRGYTARQSATKASNDVYNSLGVRITTVWTPSNHDFILL
jgi:hypothetical protein